MRKLNDKIKEIVFFFQKLPLPKQGEALDYVKWLWLNLGAKEKENIKSAIAEIRKIQSRHKGSKKWNSVEVIRKWRESH